MSQTRLGGFVTTNSLTLYFVGMESGAFARGYRKPTRCISTPTKRSASHFPVTVEKRSDTASRYESQIDVARGTGTMIGTSMRNTRPCGLRRGRGLSNSAKAPSAYDRPRRGLSSTHEVIPPASNFQVTTCGATARPFFSARQPRSIHQNTARDVSITASSSAHQRSCDQ